MFHAKEGLYFEQQPDGSVKAIVRESAHADAPVLREFILDDGTWCSIIATMSYYGEEDYGYYRAQQFHSGSPIPNDSPLKEKPIKWQPK